MNLDENTPRLDLHKICFSQQLSILLVEDLLWIPIHDDTLQNAMDGGPHNGGCLPPHAD